MRRVWSGLVLTFLVSGMAFAQATIAVSGIVRDTSGGALPGASLEAVVAGRIVASGTADENGRYGLQVPAGVPFELRARLPGFTDDVVRVAGTTSPVTRDVVLQVGRISDTLVVTASRSAESRATVTQSVTVATAEEIRALGSSSLADVMRFVPGVVAEGTGREGAQTSVFARGGESDYNLVLVDGVRVNQNGGYFDFSRISASDIDRVEIVRGAQSALWGSDAIGSVVQIFTKRAGAGDAPQVSGSVEGGSLNTWRGDARLTGGAAGRLDYHAGASHRRTDGAFSDILPQDDDFAQTAFEAGVGGALGTRASARGGVRYNRAYGRAVGPIAYGSRDTGSLYESTDASWYAELLHTAGPRYSGAARATYFHYDARSEDTIGDPPFSTFAVLEGTPGAIFPNGMRLVRLITAAEFAALAAAGAVPGPDQVLASAQGFDFVSRSVSELRRPGLRYQGDLSWANGQRLSAGYEWERERRPEQVVPSVLPELTNDNNAFFVQQHFNVSNRWFVTVGARSDVKESYDTFFSPKLSAGGYLVSPRSGPLSALRVLGNIGKGIKAPLFAERFGASYADPNPDLKVERARTTDLGLEMSFADQRVRGSITYFHNRYRDQIAFRSGRTGDSIPEFVNIDGAKAAGWELDIALQRPVAGLTASATYALVDTEVVTSLSTEHQFQPGQPLLRRPRHSGTVRASYSAGRLTANFDARWVGDRHDNSFLFLTTVENAARPSFTTDITVNPGYALTGFGVDVRVNPSATVFLRVNNLADTQHESALGHPGLPRTAVAGVRFNVTAGR